MHSFVNDVEAMEDQPPHIREAVRRLKAEAEGDLTIGGPELAAQGIGAGLVDELHLCVVPVAVGGGTPALPHGRRVDLELLDERRFASGRCTSVTA